MSISQAAKDNLLLAIQGLVARIQSTAGLSAEEVGTLITGYFADDVAAGVGTDLAATDKITTVKGAYIAAEKVLADWIGTAPEALDTLQEIADALNNDPDIINTLMTEIGTKETPAGAQAKADAAAAAAVAAYSATADDKFALKTDLEDFVVELTAMFDSAAQPEPAE